MLARVADLANVLDRLDGLTSQDRWTSFEVDVWPAWLTGLDRPSAHLWRWGTWGAVLTHSVQPSWSFISTGRIGQWTDRLPADHSLRAASDQLRELLRELNWLNERTREHSRWLGLRLLLVHGLAGLEEITDEQLRIAGRSKGMDALDGALCHAGILNRAAMRGSTRRARRQQLTAARMVDFARVPERFREVTIRYLDEYRVRVAPVYSTVRAKLAF
jgi:hypothetical protein